MWLSSVLCVYAVKKIKFKVWKITFTQSPTLKRQNVGSQKKKEEKSYKKYLEEKNSIKRENKEEDLPNLDYNPNKCIICYEGDINSLYKPCNHGGLCKNCAITNFNKNKICPLCRKTLEHIVIYEKGEKNLYQVEQYPPVIRVN